MYILSFSFEVLSNIDLAHHILLGFWPLSSLLKSTMVGAFPVYWRWVFFNIYILIKSQAIAQSIRSKVSLCQPWATPSSFGAEFHHEPDSYVGSPTSPYSCPKPGNIITKFHGALPQKLYQLVIPILRRLLYQRCCSRASTTSVLRYTDVIHLQISWQHQHSPILSVAPLVNQPSTS